jgi:hypothetical protein
MLINIIADKLAQQEQQAANPYIPALIAGFISISGVVISYLINTKQLHQQEINIKKQLQRPMTEKLYELRLKIYPKAFEITEKIKQKRAPIFINPSDEIIGIYDELISWKNGEASLVLSHQSLYCFGELCKKLDKLPNNGLGGYSKVQADNIIKAKTNFRRQMRNDVNFLYDEDKTDYV